MPHHGPVRAADVGATDTDPASLADWITEDVVQRLYAARQDIGDAILTAPEHHAAAGEACSGLLLVVAALRTHAHELRGMADGDPPPEGLGDAVATECGRARALIDGIAELLAQNDRLRAESARLAHDAAVATGGWPGTARPSDSQEADPRTASARSRDHAASSCRTAGTAFCGS